MGEDRTAVTAVLVGGERTAEALAAAGVVVPVRVADPEQAADVVAAASVDVVVVHVDEFGAAVGVVVAAAPATPVLAVSGVGEHADVLTAIRAGAAGFVVWTRGVAELGDAVRRTAAGEAVFSPGVADVVLEAHGRLGGPDVRLTDREADVLRLVVDGLTARQIASRLVLSPRTVDNHVQNVLRKLELPNRAALVRYAIERGLA